MIFQHSSGKHLEFAVHVQFGEKCSLGFLHLHHALLGHDLNQNTHTRALLLQFVVEYATEELNHSYVNSGRLKSCKKGAAPLCTTLSEYP